jgi:hypothetical protein
MTRWVLLTYKLPREPSTPRIALWRSLRRLGAAQVTDGVIALPLDARTRERLEWLADEVVQNGGEASIWLADPGTHAQERTLARRMADTVRADYEQVIADARSAHADGQSPLRTQARLRRELRRIGSRDYFPGAVRERARAAVEAIGDATEAAS